MIENIGIATSKGGREYAHFVTKCKRGEEGAQKVPGFVWFHFQIVPDLLMISF